MASSRAPNAGAPDESAELARIATLYLLKHRDAALQTVAGDVRSASAQALLRGLCDADRQVRARWLAYGLAPLLSDLGARQVR